MAISKTYTVASGSWQYRVIVTETATDNNTNESTISVVAQIYRTSSYIKNNNYTTVVKINGVSRTIGTNVNATHTFSGTSPTVQIGSTSGWKFKHNDDGKLDLKVSASFTFVNPPGTPTSASADWSSNPLTLTELNPPATITAPAEVTMGDNETVTITKGNPNASYILYYKTSATGALTEIGRGTDDTKDFDWAVPDIADTLPDDTETTYTLVCETYPKDDYTGDPSTSSVDVTAKVPDSYKPKAIIEDSGITEANTAIPAGFPFIAGYSKLSVPVKFEGSANSTAKSRSVTIDGVTATSTATDEVVALVPNVIISSPITTVTAEVTDSRNRTGSATTTVNAYDYEEPQIKLKAYRIDPATGARNPNGTTIAVDASWDVDEINGLNSGNIIITSGGSTIYSGPATPLVQGEYIRLATIPGVDPNDEPTLNATLTDQISAVTVVRVVKKIEIPLSLYNKPDGVGVDFGKQATMPGATFHMTVNLISGQTINLYDASGNLINSILTDDLF